MNEKASIIKTHFFGLTDHPWHKKAFLKLSKAELAICDQFIDAYAESPDLDSAIQKMFLDRPEKPKHWKEIMELLTCAHSSYLRMEKILFKQLSKHIPE